MTNKPSLSTIEAAQILGLKTRQMVGHLIRKGILSGYQLGRVWAVDPDSVQRELERRQAKKNAKAKAHD
jgi:hypothetical protein